MGADQREPACGISRIALPRAYFSDADHLRKGSRQSLVHVSIVERHRRCTPSNPRDLQPRGASPSINVTATPSAPTQSAPWLAVQLSREKVQMHRRRRSRNRPPSKKPAQLPLPVLVLTSVAE